MNLDSLTKEVISLARTAGDYLKNERSKINYDSIGIKGQGDFVSHADRTSERMLCEGLTRLLPGSVFMGEEESPDAEGGEWRWVVDPLDGTMNYIQGLPIYAVSIALEHHNNRESGWGDIVAGVIFIPELNICYHAIKDAGAWKDGKQIKTRDYNADLSRAVLATGFPYRNQDVLDQYLDVFRAISPKVANIRRIGSACADLAWVADGTFDGFWEVGLKPWDIAAGILLIQEAGGVVSDFWYGNPLETGWIVAGTQLVYKELVDAIKPRFPSPKRL